VQPENEERAAARDTRLDQPVRAVEVTGFEPATSTLRT
jgi:hypothetical protein